MPRTTSTTITKSGILEKSGLDVTLEQIEKRLSSIDNKLENMPTNERVVALQADLDESKELHKRDIAALEEKLKDKADQKSFEIVRVIVFGAIGLILITVATYFLRQGGL